MCAYIILLFMILLWRILTKSHSACSHMKRAPDYKLGLSHNDIPNPWGYSDLSSHHAFGYSHILLGSPDLPSLTSSLLYFLSVLLNRNQPFDLGKIIGYHLCVWGGVCTHVCACVCKRHLVKNFLLTLEAIFSISQIYWGIFNK